MWDGNLGDFLLLYRFFFWTALSLGGRKWVWYLRGARDWGVFLDISSFRAVWFFILRLLWYLILLEIGFSWLGKMEIGLHVVQDGYVVRFS